jgi:hypothetical protein
MDLHEVHQQLIGEIREQLFFLTAGYPMTKTGANLESLSELFQALGICHLLTQLDADQFRENLVRSGHARRYFLRKSREELNINDHRLALSRSDAFLSTVAAGDMALAYDIADLSFEEWHTDWEYEDDYCYFLFLHDCVRRARGMETPDPLLLVKRFAGICAGEAAPRLEVCRALVSGDADKFGDALTAVMNARQELIDLKRPTVADSEIVFWPQSYVSMEGLALIKLAGLAGLRVGGDFPLCPPEGQLATQENNFVDFFAALDEALAADSAR